jgi:hypothetical protein
MEDNLQVQTCSSSLGEHGFLKNESLIPNIIRVSRLLLLLVVVVVVVVVVYCETKLLQSPISDYTHSRSNENYLCVNVIDKEIQVNVYKL